MKEEVILIVEDEPGVRELIKLYLEKINYRVLAAESGEQALAYLDVEKPRLVLLDIEMPGMNGFDVCQEIRQKLNIPIIFLSSRRDVSDKIKCFELGGDDYITKPFDFAELAARIKTNIRRYEQFMKSSVQEDYVKFGELEINFHSYQFTVNGKPVMLSVKEAELLMLLAKHPNQVWSAEQLYDQVWGFDDIGDIQTIKVHISNLRRKIERVPSDPQYIKTVRGFGYMLAAN